VSAVYPTRAVRACATLEEEAISVGVNATDIATDAAVARRLIGRLARLQREAYALLPQLDAALVRIAGAGQNCDAAAMAVNHLATDLRTGRAANPVAGATTRRPRRRQQSHSIHTRTRQRRAPLAV